MQAGRTEPNAQCQPDRSKRLAWLILGLLLTGAVAVAVRKFEPILHPPPMQVARSAPDCDLHIGPCTARFGDGRSVSLAIEPRTIPIVTPLQLTVLSVGIETTAVEVDFAGVEMNMGFNRVALREMRPGDYRGQGTLPVCVRSRMLWEARALVHTPAGLLAARFQFVTERH